MVTTTTKSLHVATLFLPIAALVFLSFSRPTNALSYVGAPSNLARRSNFSSKLGSRMVKHHYIKRQGPSGTGGGGASSTPTNTGKQQDPFESALSSFFNGGGDGAGGKQSSTNAPPTPSTTQQSSSTTPPQQPSTTPSTPPTQPSDTNTTPPPAVTTPSTTPSASPSTTPSKSQSTKTSTGTGTGAQSSQTGDVNNGPVSIPQSVVIALIVIGASIAAIVVIWTIIRRWKFSPSRQFEDRLEPINWNPTGNDAAPATGATPASRDPLDRQMVERANSNASHRLSATSFAGASSADHSMYAGATFGPDEHMNRAPAMPAGLDYNAGPYSQDPGYADMQRGPSPPQMGYARGPYDGAAPQQDPYGGYDQYPDYSGYAGSAQHHGANPYEDQYAVNPNPYGDSYAHPQQRY